MRSVFGIKGCPMHEDPLHLIPQHLRKDFFEEYGIRIEGNLSPLNIMRLEEEYGGRIEDVLVERVFSQKINELELGHSVHLIRNLRILRI